MKDNSKTDKNNDNKKMRLGRGGWKRQQDSAKKRQIAGTVYSGTANAVLYLVLPAGQSGAIGKRP